MTLPAHAPAGEPAMVDDVVRRILMSRVYEWLLAPTVDVVICTVTSRIWRPRPASEKGPETATAPSSSEVRGLMSSAREN